MRPCDEIDVLVPGLSASTAYYVWFVAEDKVGPLLQLDPGLCSFNPG